jgi:hypothetical protein
LETTICPQNKPVEFGRYLIYELLGGGGMGTVHRAVDTRFEIEVALKRPHPHLLADPSLLQRFYTEARAAARLWHPNVCPVFDVGELGGVHYMTMRYVAGGRTLDVKTAHEPEAAALLMHKLGLAMAEAHRQQVVHRDLKPSNVLITPEGEPIITDFGIAVRLDVSDRMTEQACIGTYTHMAPEQWRGNRAAIGPACDVYALGVIFYELLTGRLPFYDRDVQKLQRLVLEGELPPPSRWRPGLPQPLEDICVRALAREIKDRVPTMTDFAAGLAAYLQDAGAVTPAGGRRRRPPAEPLPTTVPYRPRVAPQAVRFLFVGFGEKAPESLTDRLYLDVGNDLRPGVIDHHQRVAYAGSTTGLVRVHTPLLEGALAPHRRPEDPFTIVLHEQPDLDGVAASYLARAYLTTGAFPQGSEALGRYLDLIDQGALGMSLANPFSLYAAYQVLLGRLLRLQWNTPQEQWQERVTRGLELVGYVVAEAARADVPLPLVDAFRCPGLFTEEDRAEVASDRDRYQRKLANPNCRARRVLLHLPGEFGGQEAAETLLVRDVQNASDPEACLFFKDWARTDAEHCPNGKGFVGLSVFMSKSAEEKRRCILSVTPGKGVTLEGLGALLDQAESERRKQAYHGVDDRVTHPVTGQPIPPRPGYANADPWYDGRAHGYTIIDAPRSGTLLTADKIEEIFLRFGKPKEPPQPLGG